MVGRAKCIGVKGAVAMARREGDGDEGDGG
jgi:hypothetical protein